MKTGYFVKTRNSILVSYFLIIILCFLRYIYFLIEIKTSESVPLTRKFIFFIKFDIERLIQFLIIKLNFRHNLRIAIQIFILRNDTYSKNQQKKVIRNDKIKDCYRYREPIEVIFMQS